MPEWLAELENWVGSLSWQQQLLFGTVLFLVMFLGSIAAVTCILVKLPATYFQNHHPHAFADRHPLIRWTGLILKNLLGVALILIGILLSLPGIPGQGFLTILIGVMLLNFPGKRSLELRLVRLPSIHGAIDKIRARFGKPPLELEEKSDNA